MSGGPGLCQTESSLRVYECDVYIVFAVYRRGASAHDALLKFFNTSEYILGAWNTERNACLCEPGARGVAHGSGPGPGGPGLCQTESSLRVSICVSCTHGDLRYSARGRPFRKNKTCGLPQSACGLPQSALHAAGRNPGPGRCPPAIGYPTPNPNPQPRPPNPTHPPTHLHIRRHAGSSHA